MQKVKRFFMILTLAVAGVFLVSAVLLGVRLYQGVKLAGQSQPFSALKDPAHRRVLVVGDDTGVGTGALDPVDSIAGRIARDFPRTEVINRSTNGAFIRDVMEQLSSAGEKRFDVILIQAGSIDILALKDPDEIRAALSRLFHAALGMSPMVIFMGAGNIGIAPAFFPPVSWMYTERAREVRELSILQCRQNGVEYVDLFRERGRDSVNEDPERFFAADRLHPASDGYALWYRELVKQSSLAEILGAQ